MMSVIENALELPVFGLNQDQREAHLFPVLKELTSYHVEASSEYAQIVRQMFPDWKTATRISDLPFLPVGIFKSKKLTSVPDSEIFKTITSSGTTSSLPSRVYVDRATANRQAKVLAAIMQELLGPRRRPMLIVDTEAVLANRLARSARAAGVVGLMSLGRKHTFLLDSEMNAQADRLIDFVSRYGDEPLLIFGFTFMVWQYLLPLAEFNVDLSNASLIHSGGWKMLEAQSVDNREFKRRLHAAFGIENVTNFYGMAEQVGSVFIEGQDQRLHPSSVADIIIRNPDSWKPQPVGEPGIVQVLSAIPTSYPGHSLLTEDIGVIESIDDPRSGLGGKAFRILGRVPKSEMRGCSDTFAAGQHA
jgi:hypothetical protein